MPIAHMKARFGGTSSMVKRKANPHRVVAISGTVYPNTNRTRSAYKRAQKAAADSAVLLMINHPKAPLPDDFKKAVAEYIVSTAIYRKGITP